MKTSSALPRLRKGSGFTLIEMMIVVAVIAILSSIAYPSYTEYIARSKRTEVRMVLAEATQWMERHYTENYRYDQNSAGTAVADLFPAALAVSPRGTGGNYTIAISASAQRTYTLTATRIGPMANDKCGSFVINSLGVKSNASYDSSYASATAAMTACWK